MRDRDTIDSELRRIALERQLIGEQNGRLSYDWADRLLDERLGHCPEPPPTEAVVTSQHKSQSVQAGAVAPRKGKGALGRALLFGVLPLSLLAASAAAAVAFTVYKSHPEARQPEVQQLSPEAAPPSVQPSLVPTKTPRPQSEILDQAFIDTLTHVGVPLPSREYAVNHGHAVCDFLAQQPNFTAAVRHLQESSVWDAGQSTDVAASAVGAYCPQYETASSYQPPPGSQTSLTDLQAIQRQLQRIQADLGGIRSDLPTMPGHE